MTATHSAKHIRCASINIQGDTNLGRVTVFLGKYKPDVVCFQELTETSIGFFEKILGMRGCFLSMTKSHAIPGDTKLPVVVWGIGIFSRLPFTDVTSDYYYKASDSLPMFTFKDGIMDETKIWRGLLRVTVEKDESFYTIATTHFTRTPDGSTSDKQREDLKNLLAITKKCPELILCGDFNAPRGGEIFGILADMYTDSIPPEYLSSLDPKLHQLRGSKPLMVDGLFTTSEYRATDVKLTVGVSDHMAITALVSRV